MLHLDTLQEKKKEKLWVKLQNKINPFGNYDDPEPPDWLL